MGLSGKIQRVLKALQGISGHFREFLEGISVDFTGTYLSFSGENYRGFQTRSNAFHGVSKHCKTFQRYLGHLHCFTDFQVSFNGVSEGCIETLRHFRLITLQ